jgi:hypothetical protein
MCNKPVFAFFPELGSLTGFEPVYTGITIQGFTT